MTFAITPRDIPILNCTQAHDYLTDHLVALGPAVVGGIITAHNQHRGGWQRLEIAAINNHGEPTAKIAVAAPPRCQIDGTLEPGAAIRVVGTFGTQPLYTPLQLNADGIQVLEQADQRHNPIQARLGELAATGQLHNQQRLALPDPITTLGVVTAASGGAGLHDPLSVLADTGITVRHYPTPMMGETASVNIASAINTAAAENPLVLVCRGGGAATDLAAFNTLAVINTIIHTPVPVITGIGHATDTTAADTAAHHAAATPTAAAEWVLEQATRHQRAAEHAAIDAQRQAAHTAHQHARSTQQHAERTQRRARLVLTVALVILAVAIAVALAAASGQP